MLYHTILYCLQVSNLDLFQILNFTLVLDGPIHSYFPLPDFLPFGFEEIFNIPEFPFFHTFLSCQLFLPHIRSGDGRRTLNQPRLSAIKCLSSAPEFLPIHVEDGDIPFFTRWTLNNHNPLLITLLGKLMG